MSETGLKIKKILDRLHIENCPLNGEPLGIDSIAYMRLIVDLESGFKIKFSPAEFKDDISFNELLGLVENKTVK